MTKEIKLINRIIKEAVIHGADSCGSFDQNEDCLMEAILDWLEFKGFDEKYTAKYIDLLDDDWCWWRMIQICEME